ncbi:MAG: PLP-dependent aminotransferase family protein [Ferruginibacter sp.]|nr:PLP-dependent aminotransferase family protein [Cytophagales bacterium]
MGSSPVTLPFPSLIPVDKSSGVPVYLQIANGLIQQIRRGILQPAAKLPGTRAMAEALGVHRKTAVAAFEELHAQGWIESLPSKGTFVSRVMPEASPQKLDQPATTQHPAQTGFALRGNAHTSQPLVLYNGMLGFNDGFPDERLAPMEEIARTYRAIVKRSSARAYLSYVDTQGNPHLRSELSAHLNLTRGLHTSPDNLLLTRGSQMGIYLTAQVLIAPGDRVVVGDTNYFTADMTFRHAGANLVRVPVDDWGLSVNHVREVCQRQRIRAVFVTSHHHHPTTVTLCAERRIRLLSLAEEYGFAIVEDDYDYDFHYNSSPILPLLSADTKGMVIYIGSLSKAIAPAVRLGYVVAPPNLIREAAQLRRIIDRQGDAVMEQAIAELMHEGAIKRHLKKALRTYHQRRDFFCERLREKLGNEIDFKTPDGGMAIWAKFDPRIDLVKLSEKALQQKLHLSNGLRYNPEGQRLNATRMGFASLTLPEIEQSIDRLKKIMMN